MSLDRWAAELQTACMRKILMLTATTMSIWVVGGTTLGGNASAGRVAPTTRCTPISVIYPSGVRKTALAPPRPGLDVRRISPHVVRFVWWFRVAPAKCRPRSLLLSVLPRGTRYTAWTEAVPVSELRGVHLVRLPAFYPLGSEALGSTSTKSGLRTPVVHVVIS
jgi:hypothetical protein